MLKTKKVRLFIAIAVCIFIGVFLFLQNNMLVVSRYEYSSYKTENLKGFKIAQISDLHNKNFAGLLVKKIRNEKPNIIVITGDIITSYWPNIDNALTVTKKLVSIAPTYYITGNHEERLSESNFDRLINGLKSNRVNVLDNSVQKIEYKNTSFNLIGIRDKSIIDKTTLVSLTSVIDKSKLNILLAHKPESFKDYTNSDVDIVLSGHAHGGQIRLPFVGGLFSPGQGLFPKYTFGEYYDKDTTMVVSRGLGNSLFPLRVFNRPEIVIITLK